MPITTDLVRNFFSYRLRAIDNFRNNPFRAQQKVFGHLMSSFRNTSYGAQFGAAKEMSYEQFISNVPIVSYEELEPYITRMRGGERNVLWDAKVRWFAKSSGTTNDKSKFIPVTREGLQRCHFMGSRDLLVMNAERYPKTKMFSGKTLTLGGSHNIETLSDVGIRYGDLSAIMIHNAPLIVNLARLPRKEVALIPDFNKKIEMISRECSKENVTMFAGVPSWNLVMLNKVLEYTGKDNISEVWPNLEMFLHGGVSFAPYEKEFRKIIPSPLMKYNDTYNASEGFFAVQDDPDDKNMLLMLDYGVFYEFIPMETFNDHSTAIPLEEVKTGVNYAMVISNINGLWRYIIGDTVMFTSTYPYKIKITGRTKLFINVFGEEIIIDNAERAVKAACDATDAILFEYTAAPIFMTDKDKGQHEWVIEFKREPNDMDLFTKTLDETLQSVNSDYEAKRTNDSTLLLPKVTAVPENTFLRWMSGRGKVGGQNKIPRLSNERKYVEELIALAEQ